MMKMMMLKIAILDSTKSLLAALSPRSAALALSGATNFFITWGCVNDMLGSMAQCDVMDEGIIDDALQRLTDEH